MKTSDFALGAEKMNACCLFGHLKDCFFYQKMSCETARLLFILVMICQQSSPGSNLSNTFCNDNDVFLGYVMGVISTIKRAGKVIN